MNSDLVVAVVGIEPPETGGAHNAETLMLDQIRRTLSDHEIIVIDPRRKSTRPFEDLSRLSGFLRLLYLYWKSSPLIWLLSRRFAWIPSSKFERELLRKNVKLVFFVGAFDRALELKKIPFIASIWDLGHRDLRASPEMSSNREFELREWIIKNIAIKAYAIVVDSEVTKTKLKTYYGFEDSLIHALPFAPKSDAEVVQSKRESFALYPAHYWSHKNHIVLFEAIAKLLSENKNPRVLKLTGQDRGNLEYLKKKTIELGISNYVQFLGFLTKSELFALYQRAGIVVMPSLLGPTNLPPLESLLHGCPVAVTPEARENLGNWRGVIELDGHDVTAWSKILDSKVKVPLVNTSMIETQMSKIEASNVEKLNSLFTNFKLMKSTHITIEFEEKRF